MNRTDRQKNCTKFRPTNGGTSSGGALALHRHNHNASCKDCIYFSSRNCGMDVADEITFDMFT